MGPFERRCRVFLRVVGRVVMTVAAVGLGVSAAQSFADLAFLYLVPVFIGLWVMGLLLYLDDSLDAERGRQ